jgi:hypothetical protein
MPRYSDFVDRILLQPYLLDKLCPTEPLSWELVPRLREAKDEALAGETALTAQGVALVRGALYYAIDALDPGHRIFQDEPSDLGSYWHGMMHRREGDFDNARYWFRRAGKLAFFNQLHREAGEHSEIISRQVNWDPYLFAGECEQARFGAEPDKALPAVQQAEFDAVFAYTWRKARKTDG